MITPKRKTAYKVWINDLIKGNFVKVTYEWESNYVELRGLKVSRVNLIGVIIDSFVQENYVSLIVDDGSANLRLMLWGEAVSLVSNLGIGDIVLVIGKVKDYNNSIYVTPDFVRKIDNPLWLKVRKKELINLFGEPLKFNNKLEELDEQNTDFIEEKVVDEPSFNKREKVISLIEKLDDSNGVPIEKLIKESGFDNDILNVINDLIKEGEIFQLKEGIVKLV